MTRRDLSVTSAGLQPSSLKPSRLLPAFLLRAQVARVRQGTVSFLVDTRHGTIGITSLISVVLELYQVLT